MNSSKKTKFLLSISLALITFQCNALQIFLNDVGGAALGTPAGDAFAQAGQFWEDNFSDNIAIHIDVGFSTLGSNILGQARSFSQGTSYSDLRQALVNDLSSTVDQTVINNLPITQSLSFLTNQPNGTLYLDNNGTRNDTILDVNRANLKALNLIGASSIPDAEITFSDSFSFDFDTSDGISSSLFDFVGIATHEIGHALGFVSGVDYIDYFSGSGGGSGNLSSFENRDMFSVLDIFRYSDRSLAYGPGTQDLAIGDANQYFSVDAGLSAIAPFSTGRYNGDGKQASHWKDIRGIGIMKPSISRGAIGDFTESDFLAFDAIGYDRIVTQPDPTPVPIPSTLLLWVIALATIKLSSYKRTC